MSAKTPNPKTFPSPRLSDLGEFGLIARLEKILPGGLSREWSVALGDDCAVRRAAGGRSELLTQDLLFGGVHFLPGNSKHWETVGWKALAVNLSDIAAMGGEPLGAVVGLGLPRSAKLREVEALYRGLARAARRFACPVVGGDTNRSQGGWTIAVTLLGETRRRPLLRGAARPGDSLWVTGELGGAALAWRAERKRKGVPATIRRRLLLPTPRLEWGGHLAAFGKVGAAIDVSDGLAGDLGHLAEASGVGFDVELGALPRPRGFAGLCEKAGLDVLRTMLEGGEDYELLFTLRAGAEKGFADYARARGLKAARIGRARRGSGIRWLEQGRELRRRFGGFRHF